MDGVSERTFLAVNCPISFINSKTDNGSVGGYRDAMIERGIIPRSRKNEAAFHSYSEYEREILEAVLRYEYADLMIRVRNGGVQ